MKICKKLECLQSMFMTSVNYNLNSQEHYAVAFFHKWMYECERKRQVVITELYKYVYIQNYMYTDPSA